MRCRQLLLRAFMAVAALTLVFAGPSFGVRGAPTSHGNLRDFVRSVAKGPSAAQRAAVAKLHAKATYNSYGTPSTLMRPGGYLAKHATGATAAAAAKYWLSKNKVIFRLASVRSLQLQADSKLIGSTGHAVTFRQTFGQLKALDGAGLVTVGLRGSKTKGWKIAYVSSSVIGSVPLKGHTRLSAPQAWVQAARSGGIERSVVNVKGVKVARGWTNLKVAGLRDVQRIKRGAFPQGRQAVPAYEAIVLDSKAIDCLQRDRRRPQRLDPQPDEPGRQPRRRRQALQRRPDVQLQRDRARHRRCVRRQARARTRSARASARWTASRPRPFRPTTSFSTSTSGRRRSSSPTRCSRRSSSTTSRPAACRKATTSWRSATSPTALPGRSRARTRVT